MNGRIERMGARDEFAVRSEPNYHSVEWYFEQVARDKLVRRIEFLACIAVVLGVSITALFLWAGGK